MEKSITKYISEKINSEGKNCSVADLSGADVDPDPTFEKKSQDPTVKKKFVSDPQNNLIQPDSDLKMLKM